MLSADIHAARPDVPAKRYFTSEAICAALRDLRAVNDPDRRAGLLARIVIQHGLGYPEAVVLAWSEIAASGCSQSARQEALALLEAHPEFRQHCPSQGETSETGGAAPEQVAASPSWAAVKIDLDLHAIAELLPRRNLFRLMRVWEYAQRLNTEHYQGAGYVDKTALHARLTQAGIPYSTRNFNRIVRDGAQAVAGEKSRPALWRIDVKNPERIWLVGYEALVAALCQIAIDEGLAEAVAHNRPGRCKHWVDLSGSIGAAKARRLAAWDAYKRAWRRTSSGKRRAEGLQISRASLRRTWGRSKNTFLRWERRARVRKRIHYAQDHDIWGLLIPNHAYLCQSTSGHTFASWRLPNTYIFNHEERHTSRGNCRKARRIVNALLEPVLEQPADKKWCGGAHRTGRLYFSNRHSKRGVVDGYKQLSRHLRRHQDYRQRHYAHYRTTRKGIRIWERSFGQPLAMFDRDFKGEATPEFRERRRRYRLGAPERSA